MRHINAAHAFLAVAFAGLVVGGCAKTDQPTADTTAGTAAADSAMGMGGSNMSGMMNRPAAKDADQEFLRMMTDHHEGMIQMGNAAMTKGSTAAVQGDAHMMHTKQMDEQKKMMAMVQASYGESVMPMLMASNKSMMQNLEAKTGGQYDRAFYENVIAHHREAVKMVDDMMPKLANAEVKAMAQQMKADQLKEIAALEKKIK